MLKLSSRRGLLVIIFFVLFISDTVYSFLQHYSVSLDGDMPSIILPSGPSMTVLKDPFGFNVIAHDSVYSATNRFFAHWSMRGYFRSMPFVFQKITNPVNSVYLSCALAKTIIQVLIIYLLAVYITGKTKLFDNDVLFAVVLITPLFQAFGYNGQMGIIDKTLTYTWFYALPMALVLMFFLPFFLKGFHNKISGLNVLQIVLLIILIIVLSFNGPLNAPVVLIVCFLIFIYNLINNYRTVPAKSFTIPIIANFIKTLKKYPWILILACIVCLYAFYIGLNNNDIVTQNISLWERYARLPKGFGQFVQKPGPGLLLLMIIANIILLHRQKNNPTAMKILNLLLWFGIFTVIYIILLPLGGYKSYRPGIIRRDTIMPVILGLFFFYGISAMYLIKYLTATRRIIYIGITILFLSVFTFADKTDFKHNACERRALETLASSKEQIVELKENCTVMSWYTFNDYENSFDIEELLHYWGILQERKWFYWKKE
ncbi:MAG: hypothetical protein JXB00_15615 [Bacteroidales bacterium]|nr:hypothetical protein [Bacteroidales bacterium]